MAGGSNSNTTDSTIVVKDLNALAEVWVAPLDEGTEATVVSLDNTRYVLHKINANAFVADGVNIVAPKAGAPASGAFGAVWVKELNCGLDQSTSVELTQDVGTFLSTFVDIPGMSIDIDTAPAPVGGILLIDFSGVIQLNPGLFETSPEMLANTSAEVNVALLVDNVIVAVASFNANNRAQFTDPVPDTIETLAITKRVPVLQSQPALPAGSHNIKLQWRVTSTPGPLGATAACIAGTSGPTSQDPRFYMALRVIEVSC